MAKKHYDVLGVAVSATDEEVGSAYRKLAKKYHPDVNQGDAKAEERFKQVSAAHAILGDPEQRRRYDRGEIDDSGAETAQYAYQRRYAGSDADNPFAGGFGDLGDLGDLFASAFARGGGRQSANMKIRGTDVRYNLEIEFLEAATGAKKRVTMPDGTRLDLSVPAGIENGQVLRLNGKGQAGSNGGPAGDALVTVNIKPHPTFSRDGNTISMDLPISIDEAILGGTVEIPTISGPVKMKIPKGASSGRTLRLRGKGIQTAKGAGDQLVRLQIMLPDEVDAELEDLISEWKKSHGYNPRAATETSS